MVCYGGDGTQGGGSGGYGGDGTGPEAAEWEPFSYTLVVIPPGLMGLIMGALTLAPFAIGVGFLTLMLFRRDLHTIVFFIGLLVNTLVNMILKPLVGEERPEYSSALKKYHGDDKNYGMPSHHSQFIWFFVAYMILFLMFRVKSALPRVPGEYAARQRWMYFLFLFGMAASYSRVYLGYHTMEQVIGGAIAGIFVAGVWFYLVQNLFSKCFLPLLCHPIARYLLIRDTSTIPNIMMFEYCNIQKATKHRARARPDISQCLGGQFCTGHDPTMKPSCKKHDSCF